MKKKSEFRSNVWRKLSLLTLLCVLHVALFAQAKTISGVVTSSDDGSKLVGVTVVVKGTTTGTVTDINGKYSVPVKNNDATLIFSMIGMNKVEESVSNKSAINLNDHFLL